MCPHFAEIDRILTFNCFCSVRVITNAGFSALTFLHLLLKQLVYWISRQSIFAEKGQCSSHSIWEMDWKTNSPFTSQKEVPTGPELVLSDVRLIAFINIFLLILNFFHDIFSILQVMQVIKWPTGCLNKCMNPLCPDDENVMFKKHIFTNLVSIIALCFFADNSTALHNCESSI